MILNNLHDMYLFSTMGNMCGRRVVVSNLTTRGMEGLRYRKIRVCDPTRQDSLCTQVCIILSSEHVTIILSNYQIWL